jgi:hypothetical protein
VLHKFAHCSRTKVNHIQADTGISTCQLKGKFREDASKKRKTDSCAALVLVHISSLAHTLVTLASVSTRVLQHLLELALHNACTREDNQLVATLHTIFLQVRLWLLPYQAVADLRAKQSTPCSWTKAGPILS